ncbi:competence/damage-inducible protein A [Azonexus sp.]|uniref:competence/damage-inducible protein A n=1 Tax=Azonexus sp. TaxID=1872668 RepID=UPI0035AF9002
MSRTFGAVIIGDEILSGKRQDKHFAKIAELLGARGLRLSWVDYLGDDRERLTATFKRTMAAGDVVFSCGGIGNTPDDHTRQAVAAALGVGLELHPEAFEELKIRFAGEEISEQRKLLVTFPAGVRMIPNPFNRIAGFMANEHYFVPGFPQMAHPMIEWALDTFYRDEFKPVAGSVEKAFLLTGPTAYESALLDLMERIVAAYPTLRLFSLPSLLGKERKHLELGVEGAPELVERAMEEIRIEIERRGISWTWRP